MKKITLTLGIILVLGISITGYSQTTTISDSNFEQALIDLMIDSDGMINQSILTSDAAAVTGTLNVSSKSISDLTGIDAFTSITTLNVRENSLMNLNITSLTSLLTLEAGDNDLTSVNVTGLSSLERLIIHNNNLTSVNVTDLTGLRYLYAYGNNLSSLDVTTLTGLQRLYIQGNTNLSSINVTNNTSLDRFRLNESTAMGSKVSLDALFAATSTISATDTDFRIYNDADGEQCSMFDTDTYSCATTVATTTIPDSNFEQALIDLMIDSDGMINQSILTSDAAAVTETLNVSNKSISDLTGIDAFTSITTLNVRENSLINLDITSLTGLLTLEAGDNSLTSLDVAGLTNLEKLIIHNNSLASVNVTGLTSLTFLYAYGNNLSSLDVTTLTALQRLYVQGNTNLSSIDVTNNTMLNRLRLNESTAMGSKVSLDALFAATSTISATDTDFRIYNDADGEQCSMFDTDTYSCATTVATTTIPDSNFEQALIDLMIDSDGMINQSILTSDAVAVTGTLDVKNKSISDLTGIDAFTSITKLDVRENSLMNLNITSLTSLLTLEAGDNDLTSVNVTGLSSLERLIIHNNNLTSVNVTDLTGLRYLYAYGNNLSSLDVTTLTGLQRLYIQGNTNLSSINVTNNTSLDRFRLNESTAMGSKAFLDALFAATSTISATDTDFRIYNDVDEMQCTSFDSATYSCATASNEGFKRTKISISPNPTTDGILNITVVEKADYKLLNIRGQILIEGTLENKENKIDISSLSKGIYLLNLKTSKGVFTRKVVRK